MAFTKEDRRKKIKKRNQKAVKGTDEKPRLSVFRSNKQIYVQLIDDNKGTTLLSVSSLKNKDAQKIKKIEQAKLVGKEIGEKALKEGITSVRFDRNGYLYHGRIKSLAESAREAGLKF